VRFRSGLWRHPDFVRLWAGETISVFGTMVGGLALQFTAVLFLDASAFEMSILIACQFVPGFTVGLLAGAWVDRLPRRPLMIVTDIGRFAALILIPIAAAFDALTIQQLWITAIVTASLRVFFDVAYRSYLPSIVPAEQLVEGNAKLTASESVAEFAGFGVSGWLVQIFTAPGAVLIDAFSFLWSAAWIRSIKTPERRAEDGHERQHIVREVWEGLQLVGRTPIIRSLALANATTAIASGLIEVVFLLYLSDEIGFDPGVLGMIFAVGGVTSLLGSFLANRGERMSMIGPALVGASFIRSAGTLFMPLATSVSPASAALLVGNQVVTDPAWTYYNINELSLRQRITPDRLQGRMNGSIQFLEFGGTFLGTIFAGLFADAIGLREVLFLAVGFQFAASIVLLLGPVARLRSNPPAANGLAEGLVEATR